MEQTLKRTPLFSEHEKEGAKLVSFVGWEMPIQYQGILAEHEAVRKKHGLFDLSHMGEIEITGPDRETFLQHLVTNDISSLKTGQALYTVMCKENGGILDDLVIYALPQKYLLVVNASNIEKIFRWMEEQRGSRKVKIQNRSDEVALLSIQGPEAETFLTPFCNTDLGAIRYYHSTESKIDSNPILISRTGYTGEDGFEIYVEGEKAGKLWTLFREKGIPPIGLGARDTLRLEAGYLLYGNDMDEKTTPLEAGLSWVVKFEKENFIGKNALQKQKELGIPRKLIAFAMEDRSIPRGEYPILLDGEPAGNCTSGTFSPTLGKGIGLGFVETSKAKNIRFDAKIFVSIRGESHPALVLKKPFLRGSVKHGS